MTTRFIKTMTLIACAVFSTLALADPPARVGRVSLSQGEVSIIGDAGAEAGAAAVNWPVTSQNRITTGHNSRTEIRIGSTSVRLDADSSLEVSELDDDSLRLHLNYGAASVRVVNAEVLPGFELTTPNTAIRLQEPGRLRVDTEGARNVTAVNVFDGVAMVEDGGSQLLLRAGKRLDINDQDVRTGLAVRDSFDDWARLRDLQDDRSTSARYVTTEMTGYEDLDQNGVWRDDAEYGPLWTPRAVPADWAPYRDGSWTWIAPWGWTWVDNAPWGYAPFHYGRWVHVNQRWCWAPGRQVSRPVWAPALVGWVGGSGWSLNFNSNGGHRPAQGWYPLTPRDAFVPGYRLSHDHLQRINRDARPDGRGDGRGRDFHHEGLTVVPHEQFGRPGTFALRNLPRATVSPLALQNAPAVVPVAPKGREQDGRGDRGDRFERGARIDRDEMQRNRQHRPELSGMPPRPQLQAPQPGQPAPSPFRRDGRPGFDDRGQRPQPMPAAIAPVVTPPAAAAQPNVGRRDDRRDDRREFEERRQYQQSRQPAQVAAPQSPAAPMAMPPAAAQTLASPAAEQRGRPGRGDLGEHRSREPDSQAQAHQRQFGAPPAAPAPVPQMARQAPAQAAPQQPAPPAAAPAPAPERRVNNFRVEERKRGDGEKER
jgi:hypothetical protein